MISKKQKKRLKAVAALFFVVYLGVLCYLLFFFEMRSGMAASGFSDINLKPFQEIRRFLTYRDQLGDLAVFSNVYGNILLFVPFGFFLPILVRPLRGFWKILFLSMAFSICVELVQYKTHLGCADIDDVILNTIGGIVGFLIFAICLAIDKHIADRRKKKRKKK